MVDRTRAALLGTHYERWKRESANCLVWVPERWASLQPLSTPAILQTFDDSTVASSPHRHRSTLANLMAVKDRVPPAVKRQLKRRQPWAERYENGSSKCNCCRAYHACGPADVAHAVEHDVPLGSAGSGPWPLIAFDPDTWVTTVTESMTFASIDLARVDCVFHYAQPHNWAAASAALARKGEAPFFKETTPGRWKDGAFENTPRSPTNALGSPVRRRHPPSTFWRSPNGTGAHRQWEGRRWSLASTTSAWSRGVSCLSNMLFTTAKVTKPASTTPVFSTSTAAHTRPRSPRRTAFRIFR